MFVILSTTDDGKEAVVYGPFSKMDYAMKWAESYAGDLYKVTGVTSLTTRRREVEANESRSHSEG